jgi:hypothetical protein
LDKVGSKFSVIYDYPDLLPQLPAFASDATKAPGADNKIPREEFAGAPSTTELSPIEMAAAMIGDNWVADFPSATGQPNTEPAGTAFADGSKMQGTYNGAKSFFKTAKSIMMLQQMAESGHFNSLETLLTVSGPTTFSIQNHDVEAGSLYAVGAHIEEGLPVFFTPGGAMCDLIDHLLTAFEYYFGGNPMGKIARSKDSKNALELDGKSFYYSYYDRFNNHLFIYPASGAGGSWPSNADLYKTYEASKTKDVHPKIFDGYGTVSGLNDHAYTYGYLIAAAALLAMVINSDVTANISYLTVDGSDEKAGPTKTISKTTLDGWKARLNKIAPSVDQMIMDIAYDPTYKDTFNQISDFRYPKLEFMDQWTGFSWTDGFPLNNVVGHNVNSPWEQMLAWTGVVYWAQATQRADLLELGVYLYATGLNNLEVYRYNFPQSYVPETPTSDVTTTGDYVVRATNDFTEPFKLAATSGQYTGAWNPLVTASQKFTAKSMWDTMMSDSQKGSLDDVDPTIDWYGKTPSTDHRTSHATYIFQSGVYPENTYWNAGIGILSTAIYPHGPYLLSLARNKEYMRDWVNAINFQNGKAYFQLTYPTTINLLAAMLGIDRTIDGDTDNYKKYWYTGAGAPNNRIVPIPYNPELFDYNPVPGANLLSQALNPQENSFVNMKINKTQSPYQWFWDLSTSINDYTPENLVLAPWSNLVTGEKLTMYTPQDKTSGEVLQYLYNYDQYGTPDFELFSEALTAWTDGGTGVPDMPPMVMGWTSNKDQTEHTLMVYHTNTKAIDIEFTISESTSEIIEMTNVPAFALTTKTFSIAASSSTDEKLEYYINMNPDSQGDYEVHKHTCTHLPGKLNRLFLGLFSSAAAALAKAKERHEKADGCGLCSPESHES